MPAAQSGAAREAGAARVLGRLQPHTLRIKKPIAAALQHEQRERWEFGRARTRIVRSSYYLIALGERWLSRKCGALDLKVVEIITYRLARLG